MALRRTIVNLQTTTNKLQLTRSCNFWSCPKEPLSLWKKKKPSLLSHLFFLNILITDIKDEYPSAKDVPDFHFPIVQAEITECSTYAVVCRLKSSPSYNITSNGGSFNLPEYPDVCVTIPKKAVAPKAKIPLQLKVGILLRGSVLVSDHVICLKTPEIALAITILEQMCIILYICVVKLLQCDHLFSLSRLLWPEGCLVILYIVISSIWYMLR